MSDTNFQPIFDYIDEAHKKLKEDIFEQVALKSDLKKIQDILDSFAKDRKDDSDKLKIVEVKAERIEHWVIKAAEQTKIPYET